MTFTLSGKSGMDNNLSVLMVVRFQLVLWTAARRQSRNESPHYANHSTLRTARKNATTCTLISIVAVGSIIPTGRLEAVTSATRLQRPMLPMLPCSRLSRSFRTHPIYSGIKRTATHGPASRPIWVFLFRSRLVRYPSMYAQKPSIYVLLR